MGRYAWTLLVVVGCNDYNLKGQGDEGGSGGDTGGADPSTETDFSEACDGLEAEPHAVALNEECDVSLQTGSFTPVVEYDYGSSAFCGPPAVAQIVDSNNSGAIDADDLPAILLYQQSRVVALKGDGSGEYWQSAGQMGQDGGFAVGDLDGDGWPEVVTASESTVHALDGRTGQAMWTASGLNSSLDPLGYSYPAIADMDGDGTPEVTVGNTILNADGSVRGQGRGGIGAAPYDGTGAYGNYGALSVPIDLDGDGTMELVTGNTAYKPDGSNKWRNDGLDGIVAVADFDGDGDGEIVKTSGIYVTGMDTDGTEVWGPIAVGRQGSNTNLGAPAIDDLDADGTPDIVFAAQNYLIAMEWGGTEKWRARIDDTSGAAGPVLFDFELDGYPEVLYADESSIQFFSGVDGSVKFRSTEHSSYTILETPIVADVDNDDQVEIILGHCGDGYSRTTALTVFGDADETWPPGRKIWNQHAYQITNVEDLGGVPRSTAPNWPEYNSFRSGDVGRPPGEWYDLQAEVFDACDTECDAGKAYVGAWVQNAGNLTAPAGIPVSITAGPRGAVLATQYTTAEIPAGDVGEALIFALDASALGGDVPVAWADRDGTGAGVVFECDEDNNAWDWTDAVCR